VSDVEQNSTHSLTHLITCLLTYLLVSFRRTKVPHFDESSWNRQTTTRSFARNRLTTKLHVTITYSCAPSTINAVRFVYNSPLSVKQSVDASRRR